MVFGESRSVNSNLKVRAMKNLFQVRARTVVAVRQAIAVCGLSFPRKTTGDKTIACATGCQLQQLFQDGP